MRFKYVGVLVRGMELAVLGPEQVLHKEMVNRSVPLGQDPPVVLGAGFCRVTPEGVEAWGDSVSLKVRARTADAAVIETSLALMGLRPWPTAARVATATLGQAGVVPEAISGRVSRNSPHESPPARTLEGRDA